MFLEAGSSLAWNTEALQPLSMVWLDDIEMI